MYFVNQSERCSHRDPDNSPVLLLVSSCLNLAKGDWVLISLGELLQPGDDGLVGDVGVEGDDPGHRGLSGGVL